MGRFYSRTGVVGERFRYRLSLLMVPCIPYIMCPWSPEILGKKSGLSFVLLPRYLKQSVQTAVHRFPALHRIATSSHTLTESFPVQYYTNVYLDFPTQQQPLTTTSQKNMFPTINACVSSVRSSTHRTALKK